MPRPSRRRDLLRLLVGAPAAMALGGCGLEREASASVPGLERVWGVHGVREGRLHRPRVAAIDARDHLYLADLTDRIQVFDRDGQYLRGWRTPSLNVDGPSGLTIDASGRVLVADTHFYRVLVYDQAGTLLLQVGDGVQGSTPGRFGFPTDVVVGPDGSYYVSEYGDIDRIQVFDPAGRLVRHWGTHGTEPGQYLRPRALTFGPDGLLYVADSCNHRIQVHDPDTGRVARHWGGRGTAVGKMAFPYDLTFGPDRLLYVCEYGNSRVQRFTTEGSPAGTWGRPGREPGQLDNPCALAVDSRGAVHVADSNNHRIQRFRM